MAKASDLIQVASGLLNDPRNETWKRDEALKYLNDGIKRLVALAPHKFIKKSSYLLTASECKQSLPADGIQFKRVVRDMGTAGTTIGTTPRMTSTFLMDRYYPAWQQETGGPPRHAMPDPSSPTTFWVFPKQPSPARYAEVEYVYEPSDLLIGGVIPVSKELHPALIDYIMYRCLSRDGENAQVEAAASHLKLFEEAAGGNSHKPV